MTMHLVRGMSSLNNKKRKVKRKPGWEAAEAEHNKWLKKMGVPHDQLKEKKKEFKEYAPEPVFRRTTTKYPSVSTSDRISASAPLRKPQVYSGDYVVGIATMHKSNMVPVGRGQDPKEYAKMRRN